MLLCQIFIHRDPFVVLTVLVNILFYLKVDRSSTKIHIQEKKQVLKATYEGILVPTDQC